MDFMKVIDQTVREIKREVNLKVLKVPEIEQKVLDATNDEAWGPHGTALSEIAQASKRITDCQLIMGTLWMRLTDTGPNWRQVYKALTVIEYLVSHGSERALEDIILHISRIFALSEFVYVERNGKDSGINVRKKVENLLVLLNDREKINKAREKAAATRDKFFGLSSTGMTNKASSVSYGYSGFSSSYPYGSLDGSSGDNSIQNDEINDIQHTRTVVQDALRTLQRHKDYLENNSITVFTHPDAIPSPKIQNAATNDEDDDFDDFDPRSSSGNADANNKQISLIGDLLDEAPPSSTKSIADVNSTTHMEMDLFGEVTFQSASDAQKSSDFHSQGNIDLFENQLAFSTSCPSDSDLLAITYTASHSEINPAATKNAEPFDPFAEILLHFDKSKPSESFASHAEQVTTRTPKSPAKDNNKDYDSSFGSFASATQQRSSQTEHHSSPSSLDSPKSSSKPAVSKENFQVKSGIWADCFSRGLVDLNITSPKKVNLIEMGVLGELEDVGPSEKEKGILTAAPMGKAMGAGSGLGMSGLSTAKDGAGSGHGISRVLTVTGGSGNLSNIGQQNL